MHGIVSEIFPALSRAQKADKLSAIDISILADIYKAGVKGVGSVTSSDVYREEHHSPVRPNASLQKLTKLGFLRVSGKKDAAAGRYPFLFTITDEGRKYIDKFIAELQR